MRRTFSWRRALQGAVPCVIAALPGQAGAQEAGRQDPPSITVQGTASAQVTPDTIVAVFGVVTERPAAADAMAENSRAVAAAITALKAEGVKPEDIRTTNAGLTPETNQVGKSPVRIVGYRAENQLEVRLTPVERAGDILGRLAGKGVNDIESVSAVVGDDASLRDRLKGDAAREARRQADLYASALDLKLGPVTRIDPEPYAVTPRFAMAAKSAPAPAPPMPVEVGQQTVTETVRVTFSLQQR